MSAEKIYQIFVSAILFLIGFLAVFAKKRVIEYQKKITSRRNDFVNKQINKEMSKKYILYLTPIIGGGLIIISILNLFNLNN